MTDQSDACGELFGTARETGSYVRENTDRRRSRVRAGICSRGEFEARGGEFRAGGGGFARRAREFTNIYI
eukprot:1318277-Pyramimonas_sp.AAC.1